MVAPGGGSLAKDFAPRLSISVLIVSSSRRYEMRRSEASQRGPSSLDPSTWRSLDHGHLANLQASSSCHRERRSDQSLSYDFQQDFFYPRNHFSHWEVFLNCGAFVSTKGQNGTEEVTGQRIRAVDVYILDRGYMCCEGGTVRKRRCFPTGL